MSGGLKGIRTLRKQRDNVNNVVSEENEKIKILSKYEESKYEEEKTKKFTIKKKKWTLLLFYYVNTLDFKKN